MSTATKVRFDEIGNHAGCKGAYVCDEPGCFHGPLSREMDALNSASVLIQEQFGGVEKMNGTPAMSAWLLLSDMWQERYWAREAARKEG